MGELFYLTFEISDVLFVYRTAPSWSFSVYVELGLGICPLHMGSVFTCPLSYFGVLVRESSLEPVVVMGLSSYPTHPNEPAWCEKAERAEVAAWLISCFLDIMCPSIKVKCLIHQIADWLRIYTLQVEEGREGQTGKSSTIHWQNEICHRRKAEW